MVATIPIQAHRSAGAKAACATAGRPDPPPARCARALARSCDGRSPRNTSLARRTGNQLQIAARLRLTDPPWILPALRGHGGGLAKLAGTLSGSKSTNAPDGPQAVVQVPLQRRHLIVTAGPVQAIRSTRPGKADGTMARSDRG